MLFGSRSLSLYMKLPTDEKVGQVVSICLCQFELT